MTKLCLHVIVCTKFSKRKPAAESKQMTDDSWSTLRWVQCRELNHEARYLHGGRGCDCAVGLEIWEGKGRFKGRRRRLGTQDF